MSGNLACGRANGATVEVQADTLRNELRFQVTDGHGHRSPWHTAVVRRKAVPLPSVFAPFCRLGKPGDAVELVRCHVFLPGERIREQVPARARNFGLLGSSLRRRARLLRRC